MVRAVLLALAMVLAPLATVGVVAVVDAPAAYAHHDYPEEHVWCERFYSYIGTYYYWDHEEVHYSVYENCGGGWYYSHRHIEYYWYYGA